LLAYIFVGAVDFLVTGDEGQLVPPRVGNLVIISPPAFTQMLNDG
jgi:hypothetical protein